MMMREGIWFLRNISVGRIVESAVFNFFICSRERERERKREMRKDVKETTSFEDEDGFVSVNGVAADLNSRSRISSLLASTHRDFLLSPTGQQVLLPSPLSLSLHNHTHMGLILSMIFNFFFSF